MANSEWLENAGPAENRPQLASRINMPLAQKLALHGGGPRWESAS
jgi:hypothetical protein